MLHISVDFEKVVAWQTIGNTEPMTIPVNGYLAVYLSNATSFAQCEGCLTSEGDVYFDKLNIRFTRGNLKQETHYYPFGLPMAAIGSSAVGLTLNRQKYQSNEYITDAGLNWMSFGARQYDPQIGRFLSVDPMASQGGQDMLSPYQAMGNDPVSETDPGGLQPLMRPRPTIPDVNPFGHEIVSWNNPSYGGFTSEAIADMTPGFTPDTDPMGIGAWMDAAAARLSNDHFWDKVIAALNKLLPGQGQNLYNDGNGHFIFGAVYNLGPVQGLTLGSDYNYGGNGVKGGQLQIGNFRILYGNETNSENFGMGIRIEYTGDLSVFDNYDALNWIQVIATNSPSQQPFITGSTLWRRDGRKDSAPFYFPSSMTFGNSLGALNFEDHPSRPNDQFDNAGYPSFFWFAFSSLVGVDHGQYHVLATFYWGFYKFNDGSIFMVQPISIPNVPSAIQTVINNYK